MKNIRNSIIYMFLIIIMGSCDQEGVKKYYIISQDSVNIAIEHERNKDTFNFPSIPIPKIHPSTDWYSNLVIVFDSIDKVYMYQTKLTSDTYEPENIFGLDSIIKFPIYIGLLPEQMISFESNNFMSFIKANQDILQLDTVKRDHGRFLFIASNKDTIKNKAYYDFMSFISYKVKKRNRVFYIIRKTTEEEDNVIYCKRRNKEYIPDKVVWSKNFINGTCRPFTKEYDSIEKLISFRKKSLETLVKDLTVIPNIK